MMALVYFLIFLLLAVVVGGVVAVMVLVGSVRRATGAVRDHLRKTAAPKKDSRVIDRRDPAVRNRKIIPKDEGEYVPFTEE